MERTASCQCGAFRVTVAGEPDLVNVCHCTACQRRTGAPFSCNAYFRKGNVRLDGEHRIYVRGCPAGRTLANHFCPACGTTVCWTLDLRPDHYGVAVGAFNDARFPAPTYSVWEQSRLAWTTLPEGLAHFPQARM